MKIELEYYSELMIAKNKKTTVYNTKEKSDFIFEEPKQLYEDQMYLCSVELFEFLWKSYLNHKKFNSVNLSQSNSFMDFSAKNVYRRYYTASTVDLGLIVNDAYAIFHGHKLFEKPETYFQNMEQQKKFYRKLLNTLVLSTGFEYEVLPSNDILTDTKVTVINDIPLEIKSHIQNNLDLFYVYENKIYFSSQRIKNKLEQNVYFSRNSSLINLFQDLCDVFFENSHGSLYDNYDSRFGLSVNHKFLFLYPEYKKLFNSIANFIEKRADSDYLSNFEKPGLTNALPHVKMIAKNIVIKSIKQGEKNELDFIFSADPFLWNEEKKEKEFDDIKLNFNEFKNKFNVFVDEKSDLRKTDFVLKIQEAIKKYDDVFCDMDIKPKF